MNKRMTLCILCLCLLLLLASVGGVFATWYYATLPIGAQQNLSFNLGNFSYELPDMPVEEVHLLQRLSDILNGIYKTDVVTDSLKYLIDETIQVYWEEGAAPYVGSMDSNFKTQIDALFGDILSQEQVAFILKNQDLNWDGYNEIAMYSTSDPLDCVEDFDGIVCVYVTVFTPVVNSQKQITGYNLVCDSLRGYCCEVKYGQDDPTPSFSTDEWRDDLGYYHHDGSTYRVPTYAMSPDGITPIRFHYESYHRYYSYEGAPWPSRTLPLGNKLSVCLADKIPYIWIP